MKRVIQRREKRKTSTSLILYDRYVSMVLVNASCDYNFHIDIGEHKEVSYHVLIQSLPGYQDNLLILLQDNNIEPPFKISFNNFKKLLKRYGKDKLIEELDITLEEIKLKLL
jgi:hypothetical protein